MLQYTASGGPDSSALAIVTIDSPRLILAVDPLAALLEFAVSPFKKSGDQSTAPAEEAAEEPVEAPAKSSGSLSLRVEIVEATVLVLADDTDPKSQGIQLTIKEVLVSQQSILALKIDQLGMSFGRMHKPNERVTFLDQLNVALSLDTRQRGSQQMSSFEIDIPDPVIFRASYTDIMLILDIVNKASAVAQKALSPESEQHDAAPDRRDSATTHALTEAASTAIVSSKDSARRTSVARRRTSMDKAKVLVSKEQLKAHVNGFQFVLVGDLQELPFVHVSTNEFTILVNDWSGDMKAATSITTSIRYFNLANSYFEPLMDPWRFDLRVTRVSGGSNHSPLNVRLSASERLELNVTAAFVELLITSMTVWSNHAEKVKQGQGSDAPFRVRNRTGLTILVWPEQNDLSKNVTGVKRLDDGADVPWRFEDRRQTRDVSRN